jgi:hypothetical protein
LQSSRPLMRETSWRALTIALREPEPPGVV